MAEDWAKTNWAEKPYQPATLFAAGAPVIRQCASRTRWNTSLHSSGRSVQARSICQRSEIAAASRAWSGNNAVAWSSSPILFGLTLHGWRVGVLELEPIS